jgi:hypothetical protein
MKLRFEADEHLALENQIAKLSTDGACKSQVGIAGK